MVNNKLKKGVFYSLKLLNFGGGNMKMGKKISLIAMFVFILTMSVSIVFAAPAEEPTRVLCFGDSNTYGWIPVETSIPTTRYGQDVRWTGVMQNTLGSKYKIIEEGLNGRTAGMNEFANGLDATIAKDLNLNGREHLLPILKSQMPIDVVVIMLGTNDTKYYFEQTPEQIAQSVKNLIMLVQKSNINKNEEWLSYKAPKVLVVAPVPVQKGVATGLNELFVGADKVSKKLAPLYAEVAKETGAEFFDAGSIINVADGIDGIHLTAESHNKLGKALAKKIKTMTEN